MLGAFFLAFWADLIRAVQVEQDFYSQDKEVYFLSFIYFSLIILKAKIKWSSAACDPTEILILPPNGQEWLCNKPFTPSSVAKNTRCILTCNYGFDVVKSKSTVIYIVFIIIQSKFQSNNFSFRRTTGIS